MRAILLNERPEERNLLEKKKKDIPF
jgi:hypothetical protein